MGKRKHSQIISDHREKKQQVGNQLFENSRTYGNFEDRAPKLPNSSPTLKPIKKLLTSFQYIFSNSTSYLLIYLKLRKIEEDK